MTSAIIVTFGGKSHWHKNSDIFAKNNLHFESIFPKACSCIGRTLFQNSIDIKKLYVSGKCTIAVLDIIYVCLLIAASACFKLKTC